MSFIENTLEDWEQLVKKQLKTENIYEILSQIYKKEILLYKDIQYSD